MTAPEDRDDAEHHEHRERDAEEIANDELPLDPAGPTELGDAVEG